jgi:hypothetical protein
MAQYAFAGSATLPLTEGECLACLRQAGVGRLGVTWNAMPVILPVNFVLDRAERIVVRTASGTKLSAAMAGRVVAFEVDGYDTMSHGGWSVLVQGRSRVLDTPADLAWARQLPLTPWANEAADEFVSVAIEVLSGRRIDHGGVETPSPSGTPEH